MEEFSQAKTPHTLVICERKGPRAFSVPRKQLQTKAATHVVQVDEGPTHASCRAWQCCLLGAGFSVKGAKGEGSWILPLWAQRTEAGQHMAGDSPREGPAMSGCSQRPLCGVKRKPELCWRPQDIGGVRAMGYLPKKASHGEWRPPQEKIDAAGSNPAMAEPSKPLVQTWTGRIWNSPAGLKSRLSSLRPLSALLEW